MLFGHQSLRFIGGSLHALFKDVAPSTNEIGTGMEVPPERVKGAFKVGDKVRAVRDYIHWYTKGDEFTLVPKQPFDGVEYDYPRFVYIRRTKDGTVGGFYPTDFELIEEAQTPGAEKYTRRRVVLADALSRYEETCMVLHGLSDTQAAAKLSELLRRAFTARVPVMVTTEPIPMRKSSLLEGIAFDAKSETLDVSFKGTEKKPGGTYRYTGVPLATLGGFLAAPSAGSFYTKNIRNKFPCVQL